MCEISQNIYLSLHLYKIFILQVWWRPRRAEWCSVLTVHKHVVCDRDFADYLREVSPITVPEHCHTSFGPHRESAGCLSQAVVYWST